MRSLFRIVFAGFVVVAGCGGSPATSPTGTAASSATAPSTGSAPTMGATTAPSPTRVPVLPMTDQLAAGTYSIDNRLGVAIDVPAGWGTCCGSVILKDGFTGLLYQDLGDVIVYDEPCTWSSGGTSKPRGAEAVAEALSAQRDRDGSTPQAVTVGGLPAIHVRLTVPADQPVSSAAEDPFLGCDGGEFRTWTTPTLGNRFQQGPSQIDDFYLVDVEGTTLVFDLVSSPDISASDKAELEAMLASVRIAS